MKTSQNQFQRLLLLLAVRDLSGDSDFDEEAALKYYKEMEETKIKEKERK